MNGPHCHSLIPCIKSSQHFCALSLSLPSFSHSFLSPFIYPFFPLFFFNTLHAALPSQPRKHFTMLSKAWQELPAACRWNTWRRHLSTPARPGWVDDSFRFTKWGAQLGRHLDYFRAAFQLDQLFGNTCMFVLEAPVISFNPKAFFFPVMNYSGSVFQNCHQLVRTQRAQCVATPGPGL